MLNHPAKSPNTPEVILTASELAGLARLSPKQSRLFTKILFAALKILQYAEKTGIDGMTPEKFESAKRDGATTVIRMAEKVADLLNHSGTPALTILKSFYESGELCGATYGEARQSPILSAALALTLTDIIHQEQRGNKIPPLFLMNYAGLHYLIKIQSVIEEGSAAALNFDE